MYVNDALEKALPEELVKSLKEEGSLKKGSDMEELDLEEIDFEILKQRISFVLEDKRALDVEGSIIWVDMEVLDLEEIDVYLRYDVSFLYFMLLCSLCLHKTAYYHFL